MWAALVWMLALAAVPDQSVEGAGAVVPGPIGGMEFVQIPAGTFVMGDPDPEASGWAVPSHEVSVRTFELMTTEVTQGMWIEVMGSHAPMRVDDPDLPVDLVSWYQCKEFADRLDELDPDHDYRLPTEAEWEFACRAGTSSTYYWGDEFDGSYCWQYVNSGCSPEHVGTALPNALGLHDMSGNVWEWCEDWFHANYEGAPTDGSAWGEELWGWDRVIRGGSYVCEDGSSFRSAVRCMRAPEDPDYGIGFRLARTVR